LKVSIEIKDESVRRDVKAKQIEGVKLLEEAGDRLTFAITGGDKKNLTDALDIQFKDIYSILKVENPQKKTDL